MTCTARTPYVLAAALALLLAAAGCGDEVAPIAAVEVHTADPTLWTGETRDVHASVRRSDGSVEAVAGATWTLDPPDLATMTERADGSGVVTLFGRNTGILRVTAAYDGHTSKPLEITVIDAPPPDPGR